MVGRPSSLITQSAFRSMSDPPPSVGTQILRKSFMASSETCEGGAQAALSGAVNCLVDPVAYGQRLTVNRTGWRDVAHHVACRKPSLITQCGLRAAPRRKTGVTRTRLHSA